MTKFSVMCNRFVVQRPYKLYKSAIDIPFTQPKPEVYRKMGVTLCSRNRGLLAVPLCACKLRVMAANFCCTNTLFVTADLSKGFQVCRKINVCHFLLKMMKG